MDRSYNVEGGRKYWMDVLLIVACLLGLTASAVRADFDYPDFSDVSELMLNGDAAQAGNILRITENVSDQSGSAWYSTSKAHLADGFDTTFTFQITGDGADGMAFVLQNDSDTALGGGGSDLGYSGIFQALAVEIDTFGFYPETDNHISVQTNGNDAISADDQYSLAQANPATNLNDGNTHTLTIRYRPGVLLVFLDGGAAPIIDIAVDLGNAGLDVLDVNGDAWVGFTGATGGAFEAHDLLSWNFDENSDPLPTGACCTVSGCVDNVTAHQCKMQNGYYGGDGSDCGSASCTGACCTDSNCEEDVSLEDCVNGGGTFLGVGSICDFNSCQGACCDAFGLCYITDEQTCLNDNGTFHGAGSSCGPFPCGLPLYGACCLGNECLTSTEGDCSNASGTWYGAGTQCYEISCFDEPGPFGACCQPGGSCVDNITQTACEHFNGVYNGDDSLCANSNCSEGCDCVNATILDQNTYISDSTTGLPECDGSPCSGVSPAKIYAFTPSTTGSALINTCNFADFDTAISVHDGCPMTPANQIACDLNGCGTASQVQFCAVGGHTYYVRVGGESGESGNYDLLTILFAAAISEGPFQNPGNGHWYYLTTSSPWTALEQLAVSKGGHLATIDDAAENEWVRSNFATVTGKVAIGINDAAVEGAFEWTSGDAVGYTNWQSGQPDNNGDEDYGVMDSAGEWIDQTNCEGGNGDGVIEVNSVTLPGVIAGPIRNPGNCHDYYFLQPGTWIEAQLKAQALGGHLATINDAAENEWIRSTFANYGGQPQAVWIGLTDRTTEGTFAWVDGSPVGYTNWNGGEPNNLGNEDYVEMVDPATGTWNDTHSGDFVSGVIEIATDHCPCQCPLGDMNCDDDVTTADIPNFVQALLGTGFVGCDINLADMNQDTVINGQDMQLFVNVLLAP